MGAGRGPEYVTAGELAVLLGHSAEFWRERFDRREVVGHRTGRRKNPRTGEVVGERYICVESARRYLSGLDVVTGKPLSGPGVTGKAVSAALRRRWRSAQAGSGVLAAGSK